MCTTSEWVQRATFELFVALIILRRCTQRLYCIDADQMSKIIGRIVLIYCTVGCIYRVDYLRRCTQRLYGIDADRMSKINGRIVLIYCTVGCCRDVVYNVSIRTTSQCVQRQNGYNVQRLNYLSR